MSDEKKRPLIEYGIEMWWNGVARTVIYHLEEMEKCGIKNCYMFIQGFKDAISDNGFNESHKDYIKGFRYGTTGKIE